MSWSAEGCDALSAPLQGVRRATSLGFGLFWLARYGCVDGVPRLLESPYSRTIPGTPSCSQPQKPRRREAETQLCKRGTRWKSVEMCTRSEEINETILKQKLQDVKDFFCPPSQCLFFWFNLRYPTVSGFWGLLKGKVAPTLPWA